MYADYQFYCEEYHGDVIPAKSSNKWLSMASDELDTLTFGRLTFAFPKVEAHIARVKKAVCAIAEALYNIDIQRKAAAARQNTDGSYSGAISSVSSGRESISYAVSSVSSSVYAAAATDFV